MAKTLCYGCVLKPTSMAVWGMRLLAAGGLRRQQDGGVAVADIKRRERVQERVLSRRPAVGLTQGGRRVRRT